MFSPFLCCASESAGLVHRGSPPSPHWNKGSSESGHPMTSLRPTFIHIFMYLVHTSTTHRHVPVHFHSSPWESLHGTVWSILSTTTTFSFRVSAAELQHLPDVKTKRHSVVEKSWVDRKRGVAEICRVRCSLRCAEIQ